MAKLYKIDREKLERAAYEKVRSMSTKLSFMDGSDHTMQTISPVLSKCAEAFEGALRIEDLWLPGHKVEMFSGEHIALGSMKKAFLDCLNELKKIEFY